VALLTLHHYNGHPILTAYKTSWKRYILLKNEVNILEYFNLAVIVHMRPVIIGGTHYKKITKMKAAPILVLNRFVYVKPRRVT